MAFLHCAVLVRPGSVAERVRIETDAAGRIARIHEGVEPVTGDLRLGTVLPGFANAHSHAFHRLLRGTTHADGGDFWQWRDSMYRVAELLDPALMFLVARAVFAEMLVCGYTAVGEFHYLHHHSDGSPYAPAHGMELAIADAAREVGIRLVLLDTCYLDGAIGQPLSAVQRRFGDGSAAGWLERWHALREVIESDRVTLGAAIHSVRAVTPTAMAEIWRALGAGIPLHIHVSEQPQENADCLAAYGKTPVGVLAGIGMLDARLSIVHATNLTPADRGLVSASGCTVVMCPTTEADLGDGIGPAFELASGGTPIAVGSDQNAVIDPLLEIRGLEAGERLASGRRGRFMPAALLEAGSVSGYASLGISHSVLAPGDPCDLVELDPASVRTIGSTVSQLILTATATDVRRVIVGGAVVADSGRLANAGTRHPEDLLAEAMAALADA
ncbi:formimidoylglutamate deiminase [Frigoribacterium sp. CG_9.8]|uniref:formimidoylglutamate deiminase n=1 Tax=Frigoribacterium sp. CG_9.8 TaxID=2787733 RepID=UPI001A338F24|nr:formiminoglutamate deiminase [Frigoribacterium sp. CG_9.8]